MSSNGLPATFHIGVDPISGNSTITITTRCSPACVHEISACAVNAVMLRT